MDAKTGLFYRLLGRTTFLQPSRSLPLTAVHAAFVFGARLLPGGRGVDFVESEFLGAAVLVTYKRGDGAFFCLSS
jgi:hypothetical protein